LIREGSTWPARRELIRKEKTSGWIRILMEETIARIERYGKREDADCRAAHSSEGVAATLQDRIRMPGLTRGFAPVPTEGRGTDNRTAAW